MRTTVGPLPAAVYWRRRAVVIGALLIAAIVLFVSCGGRGGDDKGGGTAKSSAPASSSAEPDPSFTSLPPGAGDPGPAAGGPSSGTANGDAQGTAGQPTGANPQPGSTGGATGTGTGTGTNANAAGGTQCTDAEIALTAVPATTTVPRNTPVQLGVTIKNVSSRACSRDVGADLQELYIESGAQKIWSSDTCGNQHGSDVRQFPAGEAKNYGVSWNGLQSNKCDAASGKAAGAAPAAGQYQLRARLGFKVSEPVTITITG
jgi:hypothetical protein